MNSTISVMDKIRVRSRHRGRARAVDRAKIQTDIAALQAQLQSIANSASFNGENWLSVNSRVAG